MLSLALAPAGTSLASSSGVYEEDYPVPNTKITGKPAKKSKSNKAVFRFVSDVSYTTFKCKLDKAGWKKCKSPARFKKLKPGKHTFKVRGTSSGQTDKSPASFTWKVKKK